MQSKPFVLLEAPQPLSYRLKKSKEVIINLWEKRVRERIPDLSHISRFALRNSIPLLIEEIARALDPGGVTKSNKVNVQISKEHGAARATLSSYSTRQVLTEYELLRQTILEILESQSSLKKTEYTTINDLLFTSILQGVSEFTEKRQIAVSQNHRCELNQNEEYLQLMVESVKDYAIFLLDPHGIIVSWNEGARRLKGYTKSEIIGQHFSKFYLPEDVKTRKPDQELMEATAQGQFEEEGWRLRKDGSKFWASVLITTLRGPNKELLGFSKITRDLTERKEAEEARMAKQKQDLYLAQVKESEEQLQTLANSIPQLVWVADNQGTTYWCNQRLYTYIGLLPEQENTPCSWESRLHPDDFHRVRAQWQTSVKTGRPFNIEAQLRDADGRYRWFLNLAMPLGDSHVKIRRWFGTSTDIHEERQLRETSEFFNKITALLNSSLDYKQTLQKLADLIVSKLADLCIIELSHPEIEATQSIAAHPDPERLKVIRNFFLEYPKEWNTPIGATNVIQTGKSELYKDIPEEVLARAARDKRHFALIRELKIRSLIAVPLIAREKVLGVITLISSESGRRYTEADLVIAEELGHRASNAIDNSLLYFQAQQAIKTREEVIAIVSHDLKNPLSTILLSTNLLVQTAPAGETGKTVLAHAKHLNQATRQMLTIIDDILDATKLEGGTFSIEPYSEEVWSMIEEAIEYQRPLAEEKAIQLTTELESERCQVWCDRGRTMQVLANIIGNAIKFTPRQGYIVIRIEKMPKFAQISVYNSGTEISANQLTDIFERFRQRKEHEKQGAGLGLYIAKGIVEAHGGKIWATSKPGFGTTFYFTLPLSKEL